MTRGRNRETEKTFNILLIFLFEIEKEPMVKKWMIQQRKGMFHNRESLERRKNKKQSTREQVSLTQNETHCSQREGGKAM